MAMADSIGFAATPLHGPVVEAFDRPVLVALVDTEEDFDWRKPLSRENFAVASLADLPRAQELFARWRVVPTYLIDYPVATAAVARTLLRGWAEAGQCLVGAQLHPWVNPPHLEAVTVRNSFAGNLPADLERAKLELLTGEIEGGFGARPVVYKAGRYGLGANSLALLEEFGYLVDTSVVPYTDFSEEDGPDFGRLGSGPFWFGRRRRLLELPVTRSFAGPLRRLGPHLYPRLDRLPALRRLVSGSLSRLGALERITLTPEGITLEEMKELTAALLDHGQRVLTLSFHSPSLSPGNTPYVRTVGDATAFLATLEGFLAHFIGKLGGRTMTPLELYDELRPPPG